MKPAVRDAIIGGLAKGWPRDKAPQKGEYLPLDLHKVATIHTTRPRGCDSASEGPSGGWSSRTDAPHSPLPA
jgi:hypothetical protein